ncbi:hypothetical protein Rsub_07793 [Raphidocelis subcapitata]|uniref:Uncharacterized protein n=1 Tax=Raphidocelis subcapitata TaxID=307507 RepID=A0A2V0PE47_9CHLO|nr:hypothetical protein Rsub_07793 [Raphidocelis subcapitata]|eukprot:GBF95365.1 hypothetical protein Rsub_07793 [Raphidocelis subcapitata]
MGFCRRFFSLLLAIFLPPVSVALMRGCGKDLCINCLLTLLIFIPGAIHAVWISLAPRPHDTKTLPQ